MATLTPEKIQEIITRIWAEDNEQAHVVEDDLYREFVQYVAETAGGELAEMAKEVLKTRDIEFERWYA